MSEQGTLRIRVYTSIAQIPVEGATVVVTGKGTKGKRRLISVQVTNQSGMVRPIMLDTPDTGESTAPAGQGEPRSYASCNIWAEHPGYAMLQVENVQVFPGVETVQDMELIPLGEDECGLEKREQRVVTSQNL